MKIHRNHRQKFKNQCRLKNFSDGLCIIALQFLRKSMMDVWGVVKHYCPDSFDSAKIFDRGFCRNRSSNV
ncbi:hypothetical protein ACTHUM_17230, partial [Neisseria sp. P0021.S006]|uniref:hypothetical protein n=1 Tax=Neisseria sp. P0021.S006 TaxID=3436821 RepID=UPI003F7CE707